MKHVSHQLRGVPAQHFFPFAACAMAGGVTDSCVPIMRIA